VHLLHFGFGREACVQLGGARWSVARKATSSLTCQVQSRWLESPFPSRNLPPPPPPLPVARMSATPDTKRRAPRGAGSKPLAVTLLDVGCGLSSVGSLAALGLWVARKDPRALYATMGAGWLLSLLFMSRTGVSVLHLLVCLCFSSRPRDILAQSGHLRQRELASVASGVPSTPMPAGSRRSLAH